MSPKIHGILHLIGFDHETGDEEEKEMMGEEVRLMSLLKWRGKGLIENSKTQESASDSFLSPKDSDFEGKNPFKKKNLFSVLFFLS